MFSDLKRFIERFEGMEEIGRDLVTDFLAEAPKILAAIDSAVAKQDGPALEISAHTLKGIVGNFFAEDLERVSYDLEKMGKNKQFTQTAETFQKLKEEFELLRKALVEWHSKA